MARAVTVALWLIVVVWAFQTNAQSPQPALPPSNWEVAPPGTVFIWRNLDTGKITEERVLEPEGRLVQSMHAGQRSFAYLPHPWADNENTDEAAVGPIFPLEVGKKITFVREPSAGKTEDSIEVLRTETLTLAIGPVDCYVIESRSRAKFGGWNGTATFWYAPSLRWHVRVEITDSEGNSRRREVVEVRTP